MAVFCCALVVALFLHQVHALKDWKKEEFPNPVRDVSSCGRRGVVSWICDPDGVLPHERANKLEEMLTSVSKDTTSGCSNDDEKPGYQIGIAVMKKMKGILGEEHRKTIEDFAKHLHDRWGVGHACGDGAVFVVSVEDRLVYISTGAAAKTVLTNEQIDLIIGEIKSELRQSRYDDAVELAVQRMGEVFGGKVLSSGVNYPFIIFCLIFVAIFVVALRATLKNQSDCEDCEDKLKRIERERNAAKTQKSFEAASCPICLEDFTPESKHHILLCGHKYCDPCLRKWLETNSTCPICRQSTTQHHEKARSSPTTLDFMPELSFRLMSLHRQYPTYVTQDMVSRWTSSSYQGSFSADPLFSHVSRRGNIGRVGSGRGFGGGSSAGGGGSGGSW